MISYTALARRSGDWWAVEVAELDHVFTQARRLDQVEAMARDAISLVLEVAPDSFDIVIEPVLPAEIQALVDEVRRTRDIATGAADLAALTARKATRILHDQEGLPLRDVGRILGVSHQRAHQLLAGSAS